MRVGTLLPGVANDAGEIKGSVMLIKISAVEGKDISTINLRVTYEDRYGKPHQKDVTVQVPPCPSGNSNYFQTKGIRKAVLLMQYTTIVRESIKVANKILPESQKQKVKEFIEHYLTEMGELDDKRLFREVKILEKFLEAPQPKQNQPVPTPGYRPYFHGFRPVGPTSANAPAYRGVPTPVSAPAFSPAPDQN